MKKKKNVPISNFAKSAFIPVQSMKLFCSLCLACIDSMIAA